MESAGSEAEVRIDDSTPLIGELKGKSGRGLFCLERCADGHGVIRAAEGLQAGVSA